MRTVFKLRDGVLVQAIEHQGAAYPVVADPDVSLGWAIYIRWHDMDENAEDNIEHAKDLLDDIKSLNCSLAILGGTGLGILLGPWTGAIFAVAYCSDSHLLVSEATDGLEEIEDVLLEDDVVIPQDCTLMLRLLYLGGLPSRVELKDCGQYTKIYWQLGG